MILPERAPATSSTTNRYSAIARALGLNRNLGNHHFDRLTLPPTFIQWQLESERVLCPVGRWWRRAAERSRRWSAAQRTAVARRRWRGSASRAASAACRDCNRAPSIERGAGVRDVARAFIPRVVPFKPCLPREFLGRAEDNGWVAPESLTSHQAFERRGNRNS